jgi:hypothetical protein
MRLETPVNTLFNTFQQPVTLTQLSECSHSGIIPTLQPEYPLIFPNGRKGTTMNITFEQAAQHWGPDWDCMIGPGETVFWEGEEYFVTGVGGGLLLLTPCPEELQLPGNPQDFSEYVLEEGA